LLYDITVNKVFNFYGKFLSGIQKMKSKKKKCIEFLSSQLGEIISQEYVKKHFSQKSKKFMITIVQNLKNAYRKRISNVSWMDKQTKKKALMKLQKMQYKIGYPDFFKNYNQINIHSKNSFLQNIMIINKFEYDYEMSFLYKKPDKKTWEIMPHEINAYYHPLKNEIVFPAGILQKPFFDLSLSLPEIYGGIGAIIGHEITHGFDDQGKKFDENGNLNNWWTKNDEKQYNENASKIIQQYDNFTIGNLKVNGTLTQGENIADLGGLLISLDALKNHKKDFTNDDIKTFFESWARNWRYKITKKQLKKNLLTDVHSPNYFRVNGPVIHIDDFHKVYKTSSQDKMFLPKNKRINIW
jgi:putative endopeptidase